MKSTDITIEEFLLNDEKKDLLRILTAGSVDDGKSTLIGRLLFDSKKIYEDQLEALAVDSRREGNAGEGIDYSLLLDGLKAEREQGITIDVAYRYFSTNRRKFIIADTPGHEQYTRNMVTGGSTANLAIILVDARKGIVTQTRRHTYLVSLLGIRHIVLAVNKMDLVGYDKTTFDNIVREYSELTKDMPIGEVVAIPISALEGDNVVGGSCHIDWYDGPTLLEHLEGVKIDKDRNYESLRLPIQYVMRPNLDFRGFSGKIASGVVRRGDRVVALPSGKVSHIKSIVTYEGEIECAFTPQSVTITLEDEIDISRGDMVVHCEQRPCASRSIKSMMVWMDQEPMDPNKRYFIKHTTATTRAKLSHIHYMVNINTMEHTSTQPQEDFTLNQIGCVTLSLGRDLLFDSYTQNRSTGAYILIDPITHNTCAVGMIISAGERADELGVSSVKINLKKLEIEREHYEAINRAVAEIRRQGVDINLIDEL